VIPAALLALSLVPAASAAPASSSAASRDAQSEYLRGTLLERRGAYAEALDAYEKALALDPSAAFLAGEASELALQLQDFDRAEKWARRRLALAPADAKSRMILGRVLWARGDAKGAEEQFRLALKDDPSSADTVIALSRLTADAEPARARALLTDFLKGNPDQAARVLLELGRLDAGSGRFDDARAELARSVELDGATAGPARLALAQVYEVTGDTAAAIAQYQSLLVDDQDNVELWAHVGILQAAMGDRADAHQTFLALKARHPDDPTACAWLAGEAEKAGDFKTAAAELKDSAALKDDPTLNLRLGYYELQAGGMKGAMATLIEARKRWPKDDRIAYYLALGYDDQGDHAKAVELLREVVQIKPGDRDARWQLATILERMGRLDEAEPQFRRLIADKPDDAPALNYLGYSLADRGEKLPEAEGLIRRALAVEPANPAYRDSLGWVLFQEGKSTAAVRELAAAASALPDDGAVWEHLGRARRALGDEAGAWRAWRLAQVFGSDKAGGEADALQKDLTREAVGELWRAHLEAVHGGVRRFSAVCRAEGRVGGKDLTEQALVTFRAPKELTFEIMGPLFAPVARARVDETGFSMDRFPVEGLTDEQVRGAAEGALSVVAATLAGEPFAPGPARYSSGWGRRDLDRPAWRVELGDDGLARSVTPEGGEPLRLEEFAKSGRRRVPKVFRAKGRFWSLTLSCPDPKVETEPDAPPAEAP
jgi:tetratricopeptide (TPR) repeat protein